MTKRYIDFKASKRIDRLDGVPVQHYLLLIQVGSLNVSVDLSNEDRLQLIELLAGGIEIAQTELCGMNTVTLKTNGEQWVYVDRETLKVRGGK